MGTQPKDAVLRTSRRCCLEPDGSSNFHKLLFRREWPCCYAFDVLSIEGEDVRALPLLERKRRLARIMPAGIEQFLFLNPRTVTAHVLRRR